MQHEGRVILLSFFSPSCFLFLRVPQTPVALGVKRRQLAEEAANKIHFNELASVMEAIDSSYGIWTECINYAENKGQKNRLKD